MRAASLDASGSIGKGEEERYMKGGWAKKGGCSTHPLLCLLAFFIKANSFFNQFRREEGFFRAI